MYNVLTPKVPPDTSRPTPPPTPDHAGTLLAGINWIGVLFERSDMIAHALPLFLNVTVTRDGEIYYRCCFLLLGYYHRVRSVRRDTSWSCKPHGASALLLHATSDAFNTLLCINISKSQEFGSEMRPRKTLLRSYECSALPGTPVSALCARGEQKSMSERSTPTPRKMSWSSSRKL